MKTRFSTYDLMCSVTELQEKLQGMRLNQVYDINNKTYLLRFQRHEEKAILLLESGIRFHTTAFEWPKNSAPSGFSMKMRKHLRNKRLENMKQLGVDRVVDMQFGTGEAAYHILLELYDRGNIVLTDYEFTILYVLRPHTEGEEIRFAVREKYPLDRAKQSEGPPTPERLREILLAGKEGDTLRKVLVPHLECGPSVLEHVLLGVGLSGNGKVGRDFNLSTDVPRLLDALHEAHKLMEEAKINVAKGYVIRKREKRPKADGGEEEFFTNQEFHPMLFSQHKDQPHQEFSTFDSAVDEFFSSLEGQKLEMKTVHQEREALKKLENVRKDHHKRLDALEKGQETDRFRAELINRNFGLVDGAILAVRSALAAQMSWPDINKLVEEATAKGDPVASHIKELKLETNHITMRLTDPYSEGGNSDGEGSEDKIQAMVVDIDLDLTSHANARRYYDKKRSAAKKQQKTVESQVKAFKSAEKKTRQTLKEVQTTASINKARKVFWFEKFFWFISSENYLVIGGRDQQQNEIIVKRYMKAGDVYVHADIHGASSIIIKNPSGNAIPPKTLNEAGTMAISYSAAWEAKVVTGVWWVNADQVSKTAPTGEYLTTGSFMVRGKKNYLPPCHLIMGFGFSFRLEDDSVARHVDERRVRTLEEEATSLKESLDALSVEEDREVELSDGSDSECEDFTAKTDSVQVDEDDKTAVQKVVGDTIDVIPEEGDEESKYKEKDDESSKTVEFPDTEVHIEHLKGDLVALRTRTVSTVSTVSAHSQNSEEEQVVYLGDGRPVILKPAQGSKKEKTGNKEKQRKNKKNPRQIEPIEDTENAEETAPQKSNSNEQSQPQPKRGQKGKMKKMKEKYKDQDEEERRLRMAILQSSGSGKDDKRGKGSKKNEETKAPVKGKGGKGGNQPNNPPKPSIPTVRKEGEEGVSSGDEDEVTVMTDVSMLNTLTGIPVPEDELLFAVPVVAPYSTILNYKYKVKLIPGTGKRGKAAKTALHMFLQDKSTTQREKDLLKSVKDQDLARNIPGKVKVSAPQLKRVKKK